MPAAPTLVASTLSKLLNALKPGLRYHHPRPPGSGDAWLLAQLARQAGKTLVLLTAEPLEAQRLADEIPLFAPELKVRPLPDWETLPYDSFSPHQDLISERLRTLHALMQHEVDVPVPFSFSQLRLVRVVNEDSAAGKYVYVGAKQTDPFRVFAFAVGPASELLAINQTDAWLVNSSNATFYISNPSATPVTYSITLMGS